MCKIIRYIFFATYILFTQVALSSENIYYIDMKIVMNTSLAGKSILSQLDKIDKFNKDSFKKTEALLKKEETKIILKKIS